MATLTLTYARKKGFEQPCHNKGAMYDTPYRCLRTIYTPALPVFLRIIYTCLAVELRAQQQLVDLDITEAGVARVVHLSGVRDCVSLKCFPVGRGYRMHTRKH